MKQRRFLLGKSDFGYISRVLSVFPKDFKVIEMKRGIPNLPDYVNVIVEHDSFPEVDSVYGLPVSGWIRVENGKMKIRWDNDEWSEE